LRRRKEEIAMTRRLWILWMLGVTALLPARAPAPSIDASHTNGGLFSLTNHTSITGNFTNFATGITQLNGWELNAGGLNGTRNFGTIIVGVGTFLNSSGPLRNIGGTVTMAGGHILGGLFTNSGYFSGYGTILAPVQNHAWFVVEGGSITFGSTFENFGTFIIGANQINYLNPWSNSQTLTLAGGTICGAPLTLLGALEGFGTICAPLTITAGLSFSNSWTCAAARLRGQPRVISAASSGSAQFPRRSSHSRPPPSPRREVR
jgi:hypothetical protein